MVRSYKDPIWKPGVITVGDKIYFKDPNQYDRIVFYDVW